VSGHGQHIRPDTPQYPWPPLTDWSEVSTRDLSRGRLVGRLRLGKADSGQRRSSLMLREEENDGAPPRTRVDLDAATATVRRPLDSA
jgi:Family of unknown function (DUF6191)